MVGGPTTLSRWAGAGHLDAPVLPASQVAREHEPLSGSERVREASAHCGPSRPGPQEGQLPRTSVEAPVDMGPVWWTGGLPASSSGPSGCRWPASRFRESPRRPQRQPPRWAPAPDEARVGGADALLRPRPSGPSWSPLGVRSPRAWLGQVVPVPHPPWVSARLWARDSGQHVLGRSGSERRATFEHRYQTVLESSR